MIRDPQSPLPDMNLSRDVQGARQSLDVDGLPVGGCPQRFQDKTPFWIHCVCHRLLRSLGTGWIGEAIEERSSTLDIMLTLIFVGIRLGGDPSFSQHS